MNTLKMKITGFDESSNSLLVAFASDTTAKATPEEYPSYAYQPYNMFPDAQDIDEIVKKLAYVGIHTADEQVRHESIPNSPEKTEALRSLVGQSFEFSVSDLVVHDIASVPTPDENTGSTPADLEDTFKTRVLAILGEQGLL